jgi:hypothetical protein
MGRPGHKLNDYGRFTWEIFPEMVCHDLRRDCQAAALGPDVNVDGLSLIEVSLGSGGRGQ